MAIREIRVVPDPVLRTPCDPIKEITPAVRHLVQDLLDTVDDPGRAGLSANQIGVNLRAFSYNIDGKIGSKRPAANSTAMRVACRYRACGTRPAVPIMPGYEALIWTETRSYWKGMASWAACCSMRPIIWMAMSILTVSRRKNAAKRCDTCAITVSRFPFRQRAWNYTC